MAIVFQKSKGFTAVEFHYCPGCTQGIVPKLVAETLEELNILDNAVGVAPVGCSVFAYNYFNCDMQGAAHGRAPAVATGIKRVLPEHVVFSYQGDGDLAAIGTAEIIHAAARGEKISVFFANNAIYGMTSGQMAPTTLIGQVTTTSPFGRDPDAQGHPINVSEMMATLPGAVYVERVSLHDYRHIIQAKKAVRKAFRVQEAGLGFSLVEVLSTCPTNWGMDPPKSMDWVAEVMIQQYPLGLFRDPKLEESK